MSGFIARRLPRDGGTDLTSTGCWINFANEMCSWCGSSIGCPLREVLTIMERLAEAEAGSKFPFSPTFGQYQIPLLDHSAR